MSQEVLLHFFAHSIRPRNEENGDVLNCLLLDRMRNVTLTSTGVGTLDGNGERWWGVPGIGFLGRDSIGFSESYLNLSLIMF